MSAGGASGKKCKLIAATVSGSGQRSSIDLAAIWILLPLLFMLSSCGTTPAAGTPSIVVTIFPTTASVNVNMTTKFGATATGGVTGTVTWQVNGATGGSSSTGTIDTNGLYTAPSAVPSGTTVTVAAVSVDDTTVKASATLTILPPAIVMVSPASVPSLAAGATQTFIATVTQAPSTAVTWEVNGIPGGNSLYGFISTGGVYAAPGSPPPSATVTITAVSQVDPPQSGSGTVTLTFGTASLKGAYAFTIGGKNASGAFVRAGRFSADGAGNLTGGIEDLHDSSGVHANIAFTGSYVIGADGRSTAARVQFLDGLTPSQFCVVMVSNRQAQLVSCDSTGTGTGEADLQDNSFLTASTLNGTYVFDFAGRDSASHPISEVGEFFADGNGHILNGQIDSNDNGAINSDVTFTGSYTIGAAPNGRGTAQFVTPSGTLNFTVYIVSRGVAKFVQTDSTAAAGSILQQEPNVSFSSASLNGSYSFLVSGSSSAGSIATAGSFSTLGNGILTGGILDENTAGSPVHTLFTGVYSVDSTGRGVTSFSASNRTYTFVFYLTVQFNTVFQETDSSIVSDGVFAQQRGTPLAASTLPGNYALQWTGATSAAALQSVGQFVLDGSGNVTSGAIDTSTYPGSTVTTPASGSLTIASGAIGTLVLNPSTDNRNFALYAVSPTQMFAVGTGTGLFSAGSLLKQF